MPNAGIASGMEPMPSLTIVEQLRYGWTPIRVGRRILWLDESPSTNAEALEAAVEPHADGLAVFADYQSAGRGRLGRRWLSPRGASVLCSVLLIGPDDADHAYAGRLNMAAAVAACRAISDTTEVRPAIKWPNDLRVGGRKIAGILIESRPLAGPTVSETRRAYVIGFGINCLQHAGHFPPDLRDTAGSLELAASHPIDRLAVARGLLRQLDLRFAAPDWARGETLQADWLALAEPIGQRIALRCQGAEYSGRTVAVDPVGGLTVQLDNGRQMWFDPLLTSVV